MREWRRRRGLYFANNVGGAKRGPLDVFLMAGQSNTEGRGTAGPTVAAGQGYQYDGSDLTLANDPVGGADTGSAWPAFANQWYILRGTPACFVEQATGGTAIIEASDAGNGNWSSEGTLYDAAVTALQDALTDLRALGYSVTFRGVIWGQGEREAVAADGETVTKATYKAGLEDLITRFRDDLGATTPIWILETGRAVSGDAQGWKDVRAAQEEVAAADDNVHMVFTNAVNFVGQSKMNAGGDDFHYNQDGLDEMGKVSASYIHLAPGILYRDLFKRANSTSSMGSDYTVSGDVDFGIEDGRGYAPAIAVASASGLAAHDVGVADMDLTCDLVLSSGTNGGRGGLYVRNDGTRANGWFLSMDSTTVATLRLIKTVGGTSETVDTASFVPTANTLYTARIRAKGPDVKVWVNGVSLLAGTDEDLTDLTHFALWAGLKSAGAGEVHFANLVARAAA